MKERLCTHPTLELTCTSNTLIWIFLGKWTLKYGVDYTTPDFEAKNTAGVHLKRFFNHLLIFSTQLLKKLVK